MIRSGFERSGVVEFYEDGRWAGEGDISAPSAFFFCECDRFALSNCTRLVTMNFDKKGEEV